MGIFAITSHNHQPEENNDKPSSPQGKDFEGSSSGTSSSTNNAFVTAANAFLSSPLRKISVPVQFYSNSTAPEDPNYDSTKRHLEEAEAASDRRNLFSAVRLPSLSTSKGHHHTVSPIKVQISPAEPAKPNSITSIPSTVRITRRHTEHAGTLRKFTPPLQQPQITFLQPPVIPQVASFPEPIVISRPPPIAEEMEDYDAPSPSVMNGTAIPSLPATHYRFKLPPLQVANATLQSTNRILDSSSGNMVGSPPPKMMTNVNEPIRNKAASFASESPPPVSRYRVFFKCFFVVLFLSIPVVIFVVMMALSGGFAPFNNGTSNKTSASSTTLSPAPFTTFATAVVPTTGHPDTNWLSPGGTVPDTGLPGFIEDNLPSTSTADPQFYRTSSTQNFISTSVSTQQTSNFHSFHTVEPSILRLPTPPPSYSTAVGGRLSLFTSGSRLNTNGAYYASANGTVQFVNNPHHKQVCSFKYRLGIPLLFVFIIAVPFFLYYYIIK